MKEQNTNQMSTRQVIEIHRRAIGDMQKMCPYLLPSTALYAVISGIVPYVTVFFSARILIQWILSERAKEIVSPAIFWILSIAGSYLLFIYGWCRDDFSIILGQVFSYYIYIITGLVIYGQIQFEKKRRIKAK